MSTRTILLRIVFDETDNVDGETIAQQLRDDLQEVGAKNVHIAIVEEKIVDE